jgi:hypothetical protein
MPKLLTMASVAKSSSAHFQLDLNNAFSGALHSACSYFGHSFRRYCPVGPITISKDVVRAAAGYGRAPCICI